MCFLLGAEAVGLHAAHEYKRLARQSGARQRKLLKGNAVCSLTSATSSRRLVLPSEIHAFLHEEGG